MIFIFTFIKFVNMEDFATFILQSAALLQLFPWILLGSLFLQFLSFIVLCVIAFRLHR